MVIYPEIKHSIVSEQEAKLTIYIPKELYYFSGHFSNGAILPGVVQLDWAIYYARRYLGLDGAFSAVEVLKFQVVITPAEQVELILSKKSDDKFTFSYLSTNGQHSSGRVKLEI